MRYIILIGVGLIAFIGFAIHLSTQSSSALGNQNFATVAIPQEDDVIAKTITPANKERFSEKEIMSNQSSDNKTSTFTIGCANWGGVNCFAYQQTSNSTVYRINDVSVYLASGGTYTEICIYYSNLPDDQALYFEKKYIGKQKGTYAYASSGFWYNDGYSQLDYCVTNVTCLSTESTHFCQ